MSFNKKIFTLFSLGIFSISLPTHANPITHTYSAVRAPNEDWQSAARKQQVFPGRKGYGASIVDSAIAWHTANPATQQALLSKVPVWPNYRTIKEQFDYLRDHRFLTDPMDTQVKRAIPWRFLLDWCFERAAAAVQLYNGNVLPRPAKVFAFGNLALLSPYATGANGLLTFWYHVAPIVRDRETNQVYVLDPALNFDMPLPLVNWLEQLIERSHKKEIEVNICNTYAYAPRQVCNEATSVDEKEAADDLVNRLPNEWEILQAKGVNSQQMHNDHASVDPAARTIYGSIDLIYNGKPALLSDALIVEYKSPQENNWNTLWNLEQISAQMFKYRYKLNYENIAIGSIFGKSSRSTKCQCNYLSCLCALPIGENKIELRVKLNDQVIKHCVYQYAQDKNLINYKSYGPDIHYQFNVDRDGKIDRKNYIGGIEQCV